MHPFSCICTFYPWESPASPSALHQDAHANSPSTETHVDEILLTLQAQSDSHCLLTTLYCIYLLTSLYAPQSRLVYIYISFHLFNLQLLAQDHLFNE